MLVNKLGVDVLLLLFNQIIIITVTRIIAL